MKVGLVVNRVRREDEVEPWLLLVHTCATSLVSQAPVYSR